MKRIAAALVAAGMALSIVPAASAAENTLLTNVRTGQHPTFDRVVFDLTGGQVQDSVQSIPEPVSCGSGKTISAPGVEFLEVRLTPAAAHDENGNSTYPGSRKLTPGLPSVKSVVFTCDFEADLSIAIGVGKANPTYRAYYLTSPLRYVVDIDH
jgi:hypothetical protein